MVGASLHRYCPDCTGVLAGSTCNAIHSGHCPAEVGSVHGTRAASSGGRAWQRRCAAAGLGGG
ncbi:Hydrogenase-1 [Giardia duodenalis]|uniref:Hydrogenase-1 n=1 Tax=Giardia intestinalis TaxID=5741 RepID=V6U066_GIAIN|nr:Hydrogenase-1 [Giardia intestinalis]